jgi:broad specificity phosphatase PhoE
MVGWTDLPADLSDKTGLERLNASLPEGLLISSDLIRAVATADAISGTRRRLPHTPALREIHFGEWEMQRFDEVQDQALIRAYWENPGSVAPPGGESWNRFCARVNDAVDDLEREYRGRDIILVAHFGVIVSQIQRALGIGAYEAFSHKIDNLSVTEISLDGNWQTGRINHVL